MPSRARSDRATAWRWLVAALALMAPFVSAAPLESLPAGIGAKLSQWSLQASQVSVYARRVDADEPLLSVNPKVPRIPASVIKLLTSIAGLDLLGPEYQWSTEVYTSGSLAGGRISGNLYIKGYGDPYLTTEAFVGLLRAVRAKGVVAIDGDVVLDNGYLDPPDQSRADFDGAGRSAYNALPVALGINRQVTEVYLFHDRVNDGVGVFTEPPLSGVTIDNRATLVKAPCLARHHSPMVHFFDATETSGPVLRVTGQFASECREERSSVLVLDPEQHAAAAFDALWRELGGHLGGRIRRGRVPSDATLLHRVLSLPLALNIREINKYSNNLMARMLFLTLGVKHSGAPGSTEKSRAALSAWLEDRGFDFTGLFVENGSGLARDTRIAAADLGDLLTWSYRQPWMPELLASMAIAGVDGTVRKRLRHEPVARRAHLKTGTVRDASCIAGYVLDRDGHYWVVVVFVNALEGQRLGAWQGHAVHHEILRWVYRGAPSSHAVERH